MAGESLFLARQLELIREETYSRKYEPLKSRVHFPLDFSGGPGLEAITHRMIDRFGKAALGLGYPRVDIRQREFTTPVRHITDSFEYSVQELQKAMRANLPLGSYKAMAAQDAAMHLADRLAYLGDDDSGLLGAFTHPNVPIKIAGVQINSNFTPDQIIDLYNETINFIENETNGMARANVVLQSTKAFTYISTTPRQSDSDTTILEYLRKAHPAVFFDSCPHCSGTGLGGTDVLFAYNRDPVSMSLNIPYDFTILPEFWTGKGYEINCTMDFGGIEYRYVEAVLTVGV